MRYRLTSCILAMVFLFTLSVAYGQEEPVPEPQDSPEAVVPDALPEGEAQPDPEPQDSLEAVVPEVLPTPAVPEEPQSLPESEVRELVSEAYWRKANQWLGSKHENSGRLLMRDLSREMPDTRWGAAAAQWLETNRGLDHSGKTEFVIGSTLNGAALAFTFLIGISDDLGDSGEEIIAWGSLGGALVGLGTSLLVSPYINISDSQAMWMNFNGLWGFYNGFLVYDLLYPLDDQDAFLAGSIGVALGVGTTAALWKFLDVDEGAVQLAQSLGLFTFEMAMFTNLLVGGENVFRDNETAALLGLLVPANAAVVGGYFLGNHLRWPADDIRYISLGGVLGNLLGAAILATVQPDSAEGAAGIMLPSILGSLALSTVIVRPWRHAGEGDDDEEVTGSLLHLDERGLRAGIPSIQLIPREYKGETGIGVQVPLLTVGL
jgi:hypothetical protein